MKTKTLLIACLMLSALARAQDFQWVRTFGGPDLDNGAAIHIDAFGNVLTTGCFRFTVDFSSGAGTANITSAGLEDIFVHKMDASGKLLWVKNIGTATGFSTAQGCGSAISSDASGNIYITGQFGGTFDFDPGPGSANLTSVGSRDIFILKLNADGNYLWARSFGGTDLVSNTSVILDAGNAIDVDASGNVYVTGYFGGTIDFDPGPGVTNLTSVGFQDVFVLKMSSAGNLIWAKSFGGANNNDWGNSIKVDVSGNVYTTGFFRGSVDFDPGAGTTNITSVGSGDIFVHKMNASGDFLWVKTFGNTLNDEGRSLALDVSGNVIITGIFNNKVDFDPGPGEFNLIEVGLEDVFILKLTPSGNFVWAKSIGGNSLTTVRSITTDASGNVFTLGNFQGTVDFDPGTGTANMTTLGSWDVYIQKLNPMGNFLWAQTFGGNDNDLSSSIAVDKSGNIYTTGNFYGTADFDPGPGVTNRTPVALSDIFIHKMSEKTTGISEMGNGIQVRVYPNPSEGLVQVSFNEPLNDVIITLTDLNGRVVQTKHLSAVSNTRISIDSPPGMYFLSVKTPNSKSMVKLIKY